jgi:hypothetical protein
VLYFHDGEPEQKLRGAGFAHSISGPVVKISSISFNLFRHLEDLIHIEVQAHNLPPSLGVSKEVNPFYWVDFTIASAEMDQR